MSKGKVLITGGSGFIGSHLADRLLALGFEVTILDMLASQVHGDEPTDELGWPLYLNRECKRIRGDVRDPETVRKALKGITHLVHLAAAVGVGQSMYKIADYTSINSMGSAVLQEELVKGDHSIERIAVASSMSIYGEGAYRSPSGMIVYPTRSETQLANHQWELTDEGVGVEPVSTPETKLISPSSIYAIGKHYQETTFLLIGKSLAIPTVALRLFNVYGTRQALSNPYTGVAAIFISRLMNNRSPQIFEDGLQRRDFVHVTDVANAFAMVLSSSEQVWDVFNVGSGNWVTISGIARTLAQLLGKEIAPDILGKYRLGDIRHCYADITKIEQRFGFHPSMPFEQGMHELIQWVNSQTAVDRTSESMSQLASNRLLI